jgi:CDP-diacylglycerol--glycerol-3-phosphate 3-phosphatidyltransferase
MNYSLFNTPLALTYIRLISSCTIIPFLFIHILPQDVYLYNISVACIYVLIALTDFFDGYLARKHNQETMLGALLDPLSDKFLVASGLITLCYLHNIHVYWVLLFILREFFITGLRHIASSYHYQISVVSCAKYKTAFQMAYIVWSIIIPQSVLSFDIYSSIYVILLGVSLYLSYYSAYMYSVSFLHHMKRVT